MKLHKTRASKVRVLAQGTFDLIHPGHLYYLTQAKKHGNYLMVIVARDQTTKKIKQRAPVFSETMRVQMVRSLKVVDKAVLGGKGDILNKVIELRPDVIVLGYDQHVSVEELKIKLKKKGFDCKVVRAKAYHPERYKSSKLKKRVAVFHQKIST